MNHHLVRFKLFDDCEYFANYLNLLFTGGTRKVVLMLPDGNLMVTELSSDQFQSLNIQQ